MRKLILTLLTLSGLGMSTAQGREPILLSAPGTADTADRALVLFHGLLGSPRQSFGKIPQLMASDDLELAGHGKVSDLAVYAVDYEADFTSQATLDEVATGVAADLAASAIFRRHRHVWFVAHSMGGLVLKRTLAIWTLNRKTVLLDRIRGIGMLGVPSQGAPLADLAANGRADEVARLLGWNGGLVKDLMTDQGRRYLGSLETDWMALKRMREGGSIRRFTPIFACAYENKPESRILELAFGSQYGTIVPKLFTSSTCDTERGFSVSHTQLPKPEDAGSSIYLWLEDLIKTSAAAGIQEQWDTISTAANVPSYLAGKVDHSNDELDPTRLDRETGLPHEPERIEFGDDKSRQTAEKLILRGGPFYGSTKSELYEAIAKRNTCVHPAISANRLNIRLSIEGETKACRNGEALVCANQSCD